MRDLISVFQVRGFRVLVWISVQVVWKEGFWKLFWCFQPFLPLNAHVFLSNFQFCEWLQFSFVLSPCFSSLQVTVAFRAFLQLPKDISYLSLYLALHITFIYSSFLILVWWQSHDNSSHLTPNLKVISIIFQRNLLELME